MNKNERQTDLVKKVAGYYGERVTCDWLSPDGYEWIEWKKAEITSEFLKDVEKGHIRNIQLPQEPDKVQKLITALGIIANGNPISVGLDEIREIAQNALDYYNSNNEN